MTSEYFALISLAVGGVIGCMSSIISSWFVNKQKIIHEASEKENDRKRLEQKDAYEQLVLYLKRLHKYAVLVYRYSFERLEYDYLKDQDSTQYDLLKDRYKQLDECYLLCKELDKELDEIETKMQYYHAFCGLVSKDVFTEIMVVKEEFLTNVISTMQLYNTQKKITPKDSFDNIYIKAESMLQGQMKSNDNFYLLRIAPTITKAVDDLIKPL